MKTFVRQCMYCKYFFDRPNRKPFKCDTCMKSFPYPDKFKYHIRKQILTRDENKCQICGDNKKLHVHHKDKNITNNRPSNLITLCNQCHESQHGRNFAKPIDIRWGLLGKKLLYEEEKDIAPQLKVRPKYFYGTESGVRL